MTHQLRADVVGCSTLRSHVVIFAPHTLALGQQTCTIGTLLPLLIPVRSENCNPHVSRRRDLSLLMRASTTWWPSEVHLRSVLPPATSGNLHCVALCRPRGQ